MRDQNRNMGKEMIETALNKIIANMKSLSMVDCDRRNVYTIANKNTNNVMKIYQAILNNEKPTQSVKEKITNIKNLLDNSLMRSRRWTPRFIQDVVQQVLQCVTILEGSDLFTSLWDSQEITVYRRRLEFSPIVGAMFDETFIQNIVLKMPEELKEEIVLCRLEGHLGAFQDQLATMLIATCPNFIGIEVPMYVKEDKSELFLVRAGYAISRSERNDAIDALLQFPQEERDHIIRCAVQIIESVTSFNSIRDLFEILGSIEEANDRDDVMRELCRLFDGLEFFEVNLFLEKIKDIPKEDMLSILSKVVFILDKKMTFEDKARAFDYIRFKCPPEKRRAVINMIRFFFIYRPLTWDEKRCLIEAMCSKEENYYDVVISHARQFFISDLFSSISIEKFMQDCKAIPEEELDDVCTTAIEFFKNKSMLFTSSILVALGSIPKDQRIPILNLAEPMLVRNGDNRGLIQALYAIEEQEREDVIEKSLRFHSAVGMCVTKGLIQVISQIPKDRRESVSTKAVQFVDSSTSGNTVLQIIEIIQKITDEEYEQLIEQIRPLCNECNLSRTDVLRHILLHFKEENTSQMNYANVLKVLSEIKEEIREVVLEEAFSLYKWTKNTFQKIALLQEVHRAFNENRPDAITVTKMLLKDLMQGCSAIEVLQIVRMILSRKEELVIQPSEDCYDLSKDKLPLIVFYIYLLPLSYRTEETLEAIIDNPYGYFNEILKTMFDKKKENFSKDACVYFKVLFGWL